MKLPEMSRQKVKVLWRPYHLTRCDTSVYGFWYMVPLDKLWPAR